MISDDPSSDSMDDRETLCVELSHETMAWLKSTADLCNTTPVDVVRLLVMAPVFIDREDEAERPPTNPSFDSLPFNKNGQTQVLMRDALEKIYEASAKQNINNRSIQQEVRSMFEMMQKGEKEE
jgi:hypothetical protein